MKSLVAAEGWKEKSWEQLGSSAPAAGVAKIQNP